LRDTDIDDVIAGLVDEHDPMTVKKVAETIGTKVGLDDSDKPKIINFLRFRLLDRENSAMKKETSEQEKVKVEGMDADQFAEYLDKKNAEVVQNKVVDFVNKGGKQFNEMYIDEHIRRGLKGVLKPNYMRDLANQLGVDVKILNTFDKKDEGFNKMVNSQLASRSG